MDNDDNIDVAQVADPPIAEVGEQPLHVDADVVLSADHVPPSSPDRGRHRTRTTSGRSSRAGSTKNKSRSGSKVSMNRQAQSQSEIDEAAVIISKQPNGPMMLSLIRELNKLPGSDIDLRAIAQYTDKKEEKCPETEEEPNLRERIAEMELGGRKVQRKMIHPPNNFLEGQTSMIGSSTSRLEAIRMHFSTAFSGGKKFSGKRHKAQEDISILQLLREFNLAQIAVPVTEAEFLSFLAKSMTGEASKTMLSYVELHRNGLMSVEDVYISLTDIYFYDLRPNSAIARLRDLNDYNHPFGSLSEAHNEISQLASLAALAARTESRQAALAADWYQQTLMRVIPKEYRPTAVHMVETLANYKQRDLEPFEILNCLNRIRYPVDDLMRKSQGKNQGNLKIKSLTADSTIPTEPTISADDTLPLELKAFQAFPADEEESAGKKMGAKSKYPRGKKSGNRGWPGDDHKATTDTEGCKLCGNPRHTHKECPLFPEGTNAVAAYECRKCKSNLFHFHKYCPRLHAEASKN